MAERVLTQAVVSFLLGILACRYRMLWGYVLCGVWLVYVGILAYCKGGQGHQPRAIAACGYGALKGQRLRRCLIPAIRVAICFIFCLLGQLQYGRQQTTVRTVEEYLAGKTEISAAGTIYRKEEKNQQVIYYLKNSYIICEAGCLSGGQILVYSNTDECSIGDTIQVKGACGSFRRACNEGNFDERSYYYSKYILFRVEADFVKVVKRQKFLWQERLYHLRKQLQEVYGKYLSQKEAGVLSVMTLGEKGMLDAELKKLYQQSGISHVLAISGVKTPNLVSPITAESGLKWAFVRLHIAKKYIQNLCFKGHNQIPCHPRFRGGDFQTNNLAKGYTFWQKYKQLSETKQISKRRRCVWHTKNIEI